MIAIQRDNSRDYIEISEFNNKTELMSLYNSISICKDIKVEYIEIVFKDKIRDQSTLKISDLNQFEIYLLSRINNDLFVVVKKDDKALTTLANQYSAYMKQVEKIRIIIS